VRAPGLFRASEKMWEKLEKSAILFQRSAIFAKKCKKVQFCYLCEITDFGQIVHYNAKLLK